MQELGAGEEEYYRNEDHIDKVCGGMQIIKII